MLTTDQFTSSHGVASPIVYIPPKAKRKVEIEVPRKLLPLPATHVWGIDYSVATMKQALDYLDQLIARRQPTYAITSNLNYTMLCASNKRLADFTRKCPLVLCDGMPILWRSLLNKAKLTERVAGSDLIYALAARSVEKGHRLFLMGGAEGVAIQAAKKLLQKYPGLKIVGVECPPFRQATVEEHEALLSRIRDAKPDVLLVAFGQPKGEFWIEDNLEELQVPVSIQLGASFDFIVGQATRAPHWMQKYGLEWLYRTLRDPKRLAPRYARNAVFLLQALRRELLDATR